MIGVRLGFGVVVYCWDGVVFGYRLTVVDVGVKFVFSGLEIRVVELL